MLSLIFLGERAIKIMSHACVVSKVLFQAGFCEVEKCSLLPKANILPPIPAYIVAAKGFLQDQEIHYGIQSVGCESAGFGLSRWAVEINR